MAAFWDGTIVGAFLMGVAIAFASWLGYRRDRKKAELEETIDRIVRHKTAMLEIVNHEHMMACINAAITRHTESLHAPAKDCPCASPKKR